MAVDGFEDAFGFGVGFEFAGGDEVGVVERVVVYVGGFYFEEFLAGEEAGVGEEGFIDGTELVDAEGGVGDTTGAGIAATSAGAERKALDDALEDVVADFDFAQNGRALGVEEVGF